jgi:hypothetical protein
MHPKDPSALWLGPMHWFSDWPVGEVPQAGSLVYTIWDREKQFIYLGSLIRSQAQSARPKRCNRAHWSYWSPSLYW